MTMLMEIFLNIHTETLVKAIFVLCVFGTVIAFAVIDREIMKKCIILVLMVISLFLAVLTWFSKKHETLTIREIQQLTTNFEGHHYEN